MRAPEPLSARGLALAAALVAVAVAALVILGSVEPEPPSVRYVRHDADQPEPVDLGPLEAPPDPADRPAFDAPDTDAWQQALVTDIVAQAQRCGERPPPIACDGRFCVVRNTTPTSFFEVWDQQISYAPGAFARRTLGRVVGVGALDDCGAVDRPDLRAVMIHGPDAGARIPCWGVLPHDPAEPKPMELDPPEDRRDTAQSLCETLW